MAPVTGARLGAPPLVPHLPGCPTWLQPLQQRRWHSTVCTAEHRPYACPSAVLLRACMSLPPFPLLSPTPSDPQVSDQGGGIPRSGLNRKWTYLYTTARSPLPEVDIDSSHMPAVLAGYGCGLPLSRLYARWGRADAGPRWLLLGGWAVSRMAKRLPDSKHGIAGHPTRDAGAPSCEPSSLTVCHDPIPTLLCMSLLPPVRCWIRPLVSLPHLSSYRLSAPCLYLYNEYGMAWI